MQRGARLRVVAVIGLASTLGLPTTGESQEEDSVAVIERGTPGVEGWDVLEFPFQVLAFPLDAAGAGARALIGVAERSHWVPWLAYYDRQLARRGVHLSAGGQGPNSGTGAGLLLGVPPREGSFWANVVGGATVKRYWRAQAEAGFGTVATAGVDGPAAGVRTFGVVEHRAEDEFFGVGRESLESDRSDYELDRYRAGAELTLAPVQRFELAVSGAWERAEAGPGADDRRPDLERVFAADEVPGFGDRLDYVSVGATAAWRIGFPHAIERGGRWASVGYDWNESTSEGAADFGTLAASAGIDVPFDHDIRSVALAVSYESLRASGTGEVPFYRLPGLGAGELPSYRADRFRGRDLVLGQAEYRFRLWDDPRGRAALDASLFLYAGMVARSLSSEFRFDRLEDSYGIALNLLDDGSRFARLLLALGGERRGVLLDFRLGS